MDIVGMACHSGGHPCQVTRCSYPQNSRSADGNSDRVQRRILLILMTSGVTGRIMTLPFREGRFLVVSSHEALLNLG